MTRRFIFNHIPLSYSASTRLSLVQPSPVRGAFFVVHKTTDSLETLVVTGAVEADVATVEALADVRELRVQLALRLA